jgi:hypothetical protein
MVDQPEHDAALAQTTPGGTKVPPHGATAATPASVTGTPLVENIAPVNTGAYLARGGDTVAEAARLEKIVNHPSDKEYRPQVAAGIRGIDPKADLSGHDQDFQDAAKAPGTSRVGFRVPAHPRSGTARALRDALGSRKPSSLKADELRKVAEGVGVSATGTGSDDAVTDSDLVRAMDALLAEHPAASAGEPTPHVRT